MNSKRWDIINALDICLSRISTNDGYNYSIGSVEPGFKMPHQCPADKIVNGCLFIISGAEALDLMDDELPDTINSMSFDVGILGYIRVALDASLTQAMEYLIADVKTVLAEFHEDRTAQTDSLHIVGVEPYYDWENNTGAFIVLLSVRYIYRGVDAI